MNLKALTEAVLERAFVELEASGRHVHLTGEQARRLFGHGLTPERELSQPGQFLCRERVTIRGPGGMLKNVAVLGPERESGQVEISLTDGRQLGIAPPVRLSGDTENTPGVELSGPRGRVTLGEGVICAKRHIHMTPERAGAMGLRAKQIVRLQTCTGRPLIFGDVTVRVAAEFSTRAHLDCDEANACGFRPGDLGRILP